MEYSLALKRVIQTSLTNHGLGFLHNGSSSTLSEINKTAHGRKRRVLGHAFSDHALKSLEVFITNNVDRWCKLLGEDNGQSPSTWSKSKDMRRWANYVTFDILGELCFGKSFGMMESTTKRGVPAMMMTRLQYFSIVRLHSAIRHCPSRHLIRAISFSFWRSR